MPHEIKVGDVYSDENGRSVRIICTDRNSGYQVVGLVDMGYREALSVYTENGISVGLCVANLCLPLGPYDDWQVDDPIWVWDDHGSSDAVPSHFAGMGEDGRVKAWAHGLTSHSAAIHGCRAFLWDHASKTDPRNSK
jgi:hypothetical protein